MFERYRKPSPDPLPSTQHAERFLAAQADRLANKFTVDNQPITSTLAEIVHAEQQGSMFIYNDQMVARLNPALIQVISRAYKEYTYSYKDNTQRYDPFDDESLVGDKQFAHLTAGEQQAVREYVQYLCVESRRRHLAPEHIGTMAVFMSTAELAVTEPYDENLRIA